MVLGYGCQERSTRVVFDHSLKLVLHIRDNEKVNKTIIKTKPAEQMQDRVIVEEISARSRFPLDDHSQKYA